MLLLRLVNVNSQCGDLWQRTQTEQ